MQPNSLRNYELLSWSYKFCKTRNSTQEAVQNPTIPSTKATTSPIYLKSPVSISSIKILALGNQSLSWRNLNSIPMPLRCKCYLNFREVILINKKIKGGKSFETSVQALISCPTLCNPMDCSTPGLPVHHQLPELAQTHVHWVGDAIQPSHPLLSPSLPAFNLSQHQGLFKWVSSFHQGGQSIGASAWIIPMNIQDWFPLGWTGWISLQSKGLSRVFSNTTFQKHQFFGAQLSL